MKHDPNNLSENDPIWDLLGLASEQRADPMFSRNVMRSIRLETTQTTPWWKAILSPRPIIATAAAACIAIAAIAHTQTPATTSPNPTPVATTITEQPALDQIAAEYDAPENLDDMIDPLMLVSYTEEPETYSLDELGL